MFFSIMTVTISRCLTTVFFLIFIFKEEEEDDEEIDKSTQAIQREVDDSLATLDSEKAALKDSFEVLGKGSTVSDMLVFICFIFFMFVNSLNQQCKYKVSHKQFHLAFFFPHRRFFIKVKE
jgi:hypothetical protein